MEQKLITLKEDGFRLLNSVNREGMKELIIWLDQNGFFESPASTRFHGSFKGGLIEHSLNVYKEFKKNIDDLFLNDSISEESIIVCALLHDVCKVGMYKDGRVNQLHPKKHCKLSIEVIEKFMTLTEQEREIIGYHMGVYGTVEFNTWSPDYHLKDMITVYNKNNLAKLFYFCDDIVAQFIDS